ncbi:MAG: c-type cytochrome [Chloroflexota bacterium]
MMKRVFFVGATAVFLLTCLFTTNNIQAQDATPTPDRLAAPPTVPAPTQADEGAQLYWLHCQPCHGDRGQGLTDAPDDDWRAQYPMEDQFCWNSGCHGPRPYEDGFTIPREVPALIGEETLSQFSSAADVYNYIRAAMPRQVPGTLADEEYLAIVAFLSRAHDAWDGETVTAVSAQTIILNTPQPVIVEPTATPLATAAPTAATPAPAQGSLYWMLVGLLILSLLIVGGVLWHKQTR